MVEERWIFNTLLTFLKSVIPSLPDIRFGNNKKYKIKDAVLSAFAPLFVQCPSFLSYQRLMEQNKGKNNGRSIFNIDAIPSDNHIRNLLDPIAPSYFYPVFNDAFHFLEDTKTLDTYRSAFDTYLIALDTPFFTIIGSNKVAMLHGFILQKRFTVIIVFIKTTKTEEKHITIVSSLR